MSSSRWPSLSESLTDSIWSTCRFRFDCISSKASTISPISSSPVEMSSVWSNRPCDSAVARSRTCTIGFEMYLAAA